MKKFLINAALFSIICIATIVIVLLLNSRKSDIKNNFVASIIDKHKRLDSIKTNRLIFVGGSNWAFGVNSALVQRSTGKNVINLGIHGGLGSEFMLNEIKLNVRNNDIILLSLEYALFDDNFNPDNDLISLTDKIYPPAKSYYPLSIWQTIGVYYDTFIKIFTERQSSEPKDSPYSRLAFNKYGDDTAHLDKKNARPLMGSSVMTKVRTSLITNRLRELSAVCKKKNARLFLLYVPYARSEFELNRIVIRDLQNQINSNINFINVLGTPETFVFDDDLFFDTVNHLNRKGRELRTAILLNIIKDKVLVNPVRER